jgi:hypothetical protein
MVSVLSALSVVNSAAVGPVRPSLNLIPSLLTYSPTAPSVCCALFSQAAMVRCSL